jgi:uncharacterized protein YecE (DUF72 family)
MIYLGTSGYGYGDWKGVYYPSEVPAHGRLTYYSAEFNAVELNFTYYRMPTADHLRGLAAQTPEGFCFAVKAHQDITHNRRGDPTPFAQFRAALASLKHEGKLGAILLQFPHAFRNTQENVYYLQHCFRQLAELPVVVEFRSNDWITQRTLSLLRDSGVAFCNVDMPELPGLLPRTTFVTAPTAYVRFHGRNAEKWWQHDEAWERYNYTYQEEELAEWVPHLLDMHARAQSLHARAQGLHARTQHKHVQADESGARAGDLFVFANNHWQGQSVAAVRQLKLFVRQESADRETRDE